jgi:hypothetical protein
VRFKVFLELLLLLEVVALAFLYQNAIAVDVWLVNPLDAGVWQLVGVNVDTFWF